MMPWLVSIMLMAIAYLFGSIPTGYWLVKAFKGIDIRQEGSGSTGATNVLRTAGKKMAIAVLFIDISKGALAVALVRIVYALMEKGIIPSLLPQTWQTWLVVGAGVMAIIGHSKSIWLNFQGGKSVASSLGVLLVMVPWVALSTLGVFSLVLAIWRIVSLGSIAGAIAVIIFAFIFQVPLPYCLVATFAGIYVLIRHRANMERLWAGTEPTIGQKIASLES